MYNTCTHNLYFCLKINKESHVSWTFLIYKRFFSFQSDGCLTSPSPLSPNVRRSLDEFPLGRPGSIRRLQRTLSEDSRRRRESLPSTPISLPSNMNNMTSHSGLGHSKCTLEIGITS